MVVETLVEQTPSVYSVKQQGLRLRPLTFSKVRQLSFYFYCPYYENANVHPLIPGILAVVGHMYPVFAHFKGGKAVATSGGVVLAYNWPVFVLVLITFFIVLKLTKMVSLTSMVVSVVGFLYSIYYYFKTGDPYLTLMLGLFGLFIFYRHRENIGRIKAGTEPKVKWL